MITKRGTTFFAPCVAATGPRKQLENANQFLTNESKNQDCPTVHERRVKFEIRSPLAFGDSGGFVEDASFKFPLKKHQHVIAMAAFNLEG